MSDTDCCRGESNGYHPRGMHSHNCPVYLANCEAMEGRRWQPGDPVHEQPRWYGTCGPCGVQWVAPVDRCPSCGELSTEALRAALAERDAR